MDSQRIPDDCFYVVTPIKGDEAGLDVHAMVGELGQARLDGLGHRLGVPRPGHPVRIKPDDEDAR